MNYEHIRRLTKGLSADIGIETAKKLLEKGIEVYEKTSFDSYKNMEITQGMFSEEEMSGQYDLYVSAADMEYAGAYLTELGLQQYLCTTEESKVVKSAAEAAEEEYYKKRKIRLIECAVVIVLGAVYMIYKSLAG